MKSVRRHFFGVRGLRVPIVDHWQEQHNASCDARKSRQGADSMGGNTFDMQVCRIRNQSLFWLCGRFLHHPWCHKVSRATLWYHWSGFLGHSSVHTLHHCTLWEASVTRFFLSSADETYSMEGMNRIAGRCLQSEATEQEFDEKVRGTPRAEG